MSDKKELKKQKQEKRELALRANLQRRKQQTRERIQNINTEKDNDKCQ